MNKKIGKGKQPLAQALKKMGYKISQVVELLGTTRSTFYKKASHPTIAFLQEVQAVTNSKLDTYFPELKTEQKGQPIETDEACKKAIQQRYYQVLDDHNALATHYTSATTLLLRVANNNKSETLKEEINAFINNHLA